jgi:hypothetical protein
MIRSTRFTTSRELQPTGLIKFSTPNMCDWLLRFVGVE